MEPEAIQAIAQLFAEAMNQLAFISAIIGGFAVALLAGVLGRERSTLTRWTVGTLSAAALLQISCTMFFTMISFRILILSANRKFDELIKLIDGIDPSLTPFVIAFLGSFLLFFIGIALTGWLFGRITGWLASGVALVASILALYGLAVVM